MKQGYGELVDQITKLLQEHGSLTRAELCLHLGRARDEVAAVVSRMARPGKTVPKRVRVVGYVYDQDRQRRYPRAVYALGDGPDVKKPKPDPKEVKRRYNAAKRAKRTMNFVFNLGLPRRVFDRGQSNFDASSAGVGL